MKAEEMKEVYLRAAENIATGEFIYSCLAVSHMEGCAKGTALQFYQDIMKPKNCDEYDWAQRIGHWENKKAINIRVLLLCLMAALVEDLYAE